MKGKIQDKNRQEAAANKLGVEVVSLTRVLQLGECRAI